jgi:3-oxoacyl-[acyl-carrier protein] reductase
MLRNDLLPCCTVQLSCGVGAELMEAASEGKGLAVLTGASGAIGRAIAVVLLDEGYRVVAADVDPAVHGAFSQYGNVHTVVADLSSELGVRTLVAAVDALPAPVEVLINNAGVLSNNKLADTTLEEWRRVMAINVEAALLLSQRWIPEMQRRGMGRVINICSLAMKTGGLTAGTAYSVSKGALGTLTLSLARETAGSGVTVNGVAPAYVRSPMVTDLLTDAQRQQLVREIPVGRFCEPEEVAHAVAFLVSPLAGFITGEIVDVNGGLHLD